MAEQLNNNTGIGIKCGLNNALILVRWRRKWQPTPIFLPEKYPMGRGVVGYSLLQRVGRDFATEHAQIGSFIVTNVSWV